MSNSFLLTALISIWMSSLLTHHWLCIIISRTSLQSFFQARVVVIMEKERCHGCDKWFTWIEQHLTYHNHCWSVMVEHACQQRLIVECWLQPQQEHGPLNRNNSCCFCPWGWQWYVYWYVYQRHQEAMMHQARRGQPIKHNICEGSDIVDDFGPIIASPSGDVDPMEADLHSYMFP